MPSIQTASIPVTSFPNEFVSPWGNDEPIPLYSSVPLRSPVVGCLPCVVCGNSNTRYEIIGSPNANPITGDRAGGDGGGGGGVGGGGGGGGDGVVITLLPSSPPPCITTNKRFLGPGSEPQEGMIIVNRFIINLSGLEFCPCINLDDPSLPCSTEFQEYWDYIVSNLYSELSNPIVLEYIPINSPNYSQISGDPYFCINGGDQIFPPNEPFSVLPIIGGDGFPCSTPMFFNGLCVTSETETSITVSNSQTLEADCGPRTFPLAYGGSVTITWE
jgi:hypothetical protein